MALKPEQIKEREAVRIVLDEEAAHGHQARFITSWAEQREEGCDVISTAPDGRVDRIEVKAWGDPLLDAKGKFTWAQDIRVSQFECASVDPTYRIEIVGGMDDWILGAGRYERLTVDRRWILDHSTPRGYDVDISGLEAAVRVIAGGTTITIEPPAESGSGRPS